ncbi:uncharacterized protein LOC111715754 [Eurytemora carolleeae]|uniref:uncharacterized protein LOC111715754 n=1 Tax=Eurytemora carolleeae TaxID=1294199 RepID=UPI000C77DA4E|nr:uncharacterized protein LOC111715754 [Eurytemora carolleeae]|eukprot:XP_023346896.1 uncharacterized protein LOC111715754 [Eurytemora affinis]
MKDVWEKRWIIYKFILLFFTIIAIDQTFRSRILIGPEEVLQTITISRAPAKMKKLDLFEKAEYIHDYCNSTNIKPTNQTNDIFYYLKSPKVGVKNLLICLPARMGTKPVLETLNTAYQTSCHKNKTECQKTVPDSNTLKIMFTRHPLDRLIIGFRQHKQNSSSSISNHNRKLLFTRPRNQSKFKYSNKHFIRYRLTSLELFFSNRNPLITAGQVFFFLTTLFNTKINQP